METTYKLTYSAPSIKVLPLRTERGFQTSFGTCSVRRSNNNAIFTLSTLLGDSQTTSDGGYVAGGGFDTYGSSFGRDEIDGGFWGN